jgi:membrane protease YdiL (CAAX protease family)
MKRIWPGVLIFVLLFIVLGFAIFHFGLGHFLAESYENAKNKNYFNNILLAGIVVGVLFSILCSVAGYFLAKKKARNRIGWTILCLWLNLWAFLVLFLLPPSTVGKKKNRRGNRVIQ